jgi:hypothetical protein
LYRDDRPCIPIGLGLVSPCVRGVLQDVKKNAVLDCFWFRKRGV